MSGHQLLSGCFDWTLSDHVDDKKVKFGWKKKQTKWFDIISLPVRSREFYWSIWWFSSVMPVHLADRKWWPLTLSTRPSRQHYQQGPTGSIESDRSHQITTSVPVPAASALLSKSQTLPGTKKVAETTCGAVGCQCYCWGGSWVCVSVCCMQNRVLFGSLTSNMCKLFVQYMTVLKIKLSLLLSKTNKSHNWISVTVSFVYFVQKIS